jgi:hypothetical protein
MHLKLNIIFTWVQVSHHALVQCLLFRCSQSGGRHSLQLCVLRELVVGEIVVDLKEGLKNLNI